jgi:SAM-dependent methyltransferase
MRVSSQRHWDTFWDNPDPRIQHQQYNPKLVQALVGLLGSLDGKRLLEAGCGTALDSAELSRRGATVYALDYSEQALEIAQKKADEQKDRLNFIKGDLHTLPFAASSFDAVFHAGVLEHFRNPIRILQEQHRILKDAGILVVDVPQSFNLYTLYKARLIRAGTWFAGWETQFAIGELESLVAEAGFQILGAYGYGYFPSSLMKIRWASSMGQGLIGRPFMPSGVAEAYESTWRKFEGTRAFLYVAQNIGVIARKVSGC